MKALILGEIPPEIAAKTIDYLVITITRPTSGFNWSSPHSVFWRRKAVPKHSKIYPSTGWRRTVFIFSGRARRGSLK